MNNESERINAVVEQLYASVNEPWESLKQTLDQHGCEKLGNLNETGSGAWHLYHIAEVFRVHARAVMGSDEIKGWPALEQSTEHAAKTIRDDVERFGEWCLDHPSQCTDVIHGDKMGFEEMIGVMLRHIVWHAAAVHYWCLWKKS
ncbi:MAG: hypothetical protein P1U42_04265 [Phycisphaerales bacterium]|nr:hypothetical protein [Phycisphaerales bacterium]